MSERFDRLTAIMERLRAPDGCPWDRKQTHDSLKPYLLEEAYEVLETIDEGNMAKLREELGDVLLQVVFHAQLASERGDFTIETIIEILNQKLIRRHPHVFDRQEGDPQTPDQVKHRWERIKSQERKDAGETRSLVDGVPKTLPALLRAYQVQARASRVGFDWPDPEQVLEKLEEEIQELNDASRAHREQAASDETNRITQERVEAEFGDVLFSLVNLARFLKVNPEEALRKTIGRFLSRFQYIEARASESGRPLEEMSLEEMDVWWDEAKANESEGSERRSVMDAPQVQGDSYNEHRNDSEA